MFDLSAQTIFVTLAGSQAHGTARPGSDVDLRGVCIAPLSVRLSLFEHFEQFEGPLEGAMLLAVRERLASHPTASRALEVKTEAVTFDVGKLLSMLVEANPNALEILFADREDWLYDSPWWRRLHADRYHFLTRKVEQTFLGYALAQLKRIRTHRGWLLHPPAAKPFRESFGLPPTGLLNRDERERIEEALAAKVRSYGVDDLDLPKSARIALRDRLQAFWIDALAAPAEDLENRMRWLAGQALGLPPAVVAALNAERQYRAAMKHWESYQHWLEHRNRARAELERRFGYDTKHAMHLVRLMRMGLEALNSGELHVRRPDAEELIAIRDGALTFEALLEEAERLRMKIQAAGSSTCLPAEVDRTHVDSLARELMQGFSVSSHLAQEGLSAV